MPADSSSQQGEAGQQRLRAGLLEKVSPASLTFAVYLAGQLFLPIAAFGDLAVQPGGFAEVIGNALPYGPSLNRATCWGLLVFLLAIGLSRGKLPRIRPWLDGSVLLWLLTPLLCSLANDSTFGAAAAQSLYLAATWGAPYAAARLVYRGPADLVACLKVIVIFGVGTLCLAFAEFVWGRFFYALCYGPHPFQTEGESRYFGYRPLLFFEDPNQIAMWWATVAVASLALFRSAGKRLPNRHYLLALTLPPFLFQAIGGALLTIFATVVLHVRKPRTIAVWMLGLSLLGGCLFLARGPILRTAKDFAHNNPAGQRLKSAIRASNLGSFTWRLGLEEKNFAAIEQRPFFGWGDIHFWKVDDSSVRPWGLASLVLGTFGLVGWSVWLAMLLVPCAVVLARGYGRQEAERWAVRAMAVIVLVHVIDATLNSAFFMPTVMLLGFVNAGVGRPNLTLGLEAESCDTAI